MEARQAKEIPSGAQWQYEPEWDGFRCIAFRDGDRVELQSRKMDDWKLLAAKLVVEVQYDHFSEGAFDTEPIYALETRQGTSRLRI
jgi:ATP-dependent DNA ligase